MAKRSFGIFYIDANKGYFYGSNATSIVQVDIPSDTMAYFDVVNRDKFYQIIQNLITANKLEPVPMLILVSPFATYEKDSTTKLPDQASTDIQQFLDSVPFDKVLSRSYKVADTTKVVATNKELYDVIRHGFEKNRFSTTAVVSLSLLQKMMPEIGTTLNLEVIASKYDSIKQYSFITQDEINNPTKPSLQTEETSKPNPMRMYVLIGVFAVLIIILVVMVVTTMQQPAPKPVTTTQPSSSTNAVVSTPTPTTAPAARGTKEGTPSGQILSPTPRATTAGKEITR